MWTSEEREVVTDDEPIKLSRKGTSDGFTIPAHWLKTIRGLKREPLIYYAHVEKDDAGRFYIIFEKARAQPPELKLNGNGRR